MSGFFRKLFDSFSIQSDIKTIQDVKDKLNAIENKKKNLEEEIEKCEKNILKKKEEIKTLIILYSMDDEEEEDTDEEEEDTDDESESSTYNQNQSQNIFEKSRINNLIKTIIKTKTNDTNMLKYVENLIEELNMDTDSENSEIENITMKLNLLMEECKQNILLIKEYTKNLKMLNITIVNLNNMKLKIEMSNDS